MKKKTTTPPPAPNNSGTSVLGTLYLEHVPYYQYSESSGCFCAVDTPITVHSHDSSNPAGKSGSGPRGRKLKLATLNILADCFPWYVELAISSKKRIASTVEAIEQLNADVLGLNEVTNSSLDSILRSDFVRRNYFASAVPTSSSRAERNDLKPHGCVLLSKIPFKALYLARWSDKKSRAAVCGVFQGHHRADPETRASHDGQSNSDEMRREEASGESGLSNDDDFVVCSLHTQAYQTLPNRRMREEQLGGLCGLMRTSPKLSHRFVIMGDLNLHYLNEDAFVLNNCLIDAWAETHFGEGGDQDPGFTFDSKTNSMIKRYIPGEQRRMRLDRILYSESFPFAPARDDPACSLWANTAADAAKEIFPSDHYGLAVTMSALPAGHCAPSSPAVQQVLSSHAALPCEKHAFSWIKFSFGLFPHTVWLIGRAANVV